MNGLHLIGDLTGCRCDPQLLLDGERFRSKCVEMVEAAGLTTVGVSFHQFEGFGFTGCIVLAESHLAIHTWPERQGLTLDVYVCNYSADNSAKARSLFDTQQFATAIYQSELTFRLRNFGYQIEAGRSGAPEIKGYTAEYLEASSPRSKQIRQIGCRNNSSR